MCELVHIFDGASHFQMISWNDAHVYILLADDSCTSIAKGIPMETMKYQMLKE